MEPEPSTGTGTTHSTSSLDDSSQIKTQPEIMKDSRDETNIAQEEKITIIIDSQIQQDLRDKDKPQPGKPKDSSVSLQTKMIKEDGSKGMWESSFVMTIAFGAMITVMFLKKNPGQSLELGTFCVLDALTFFSGCCLLLHSVFTVFSGTADTQIHQTTSKVLLIISITFLVLTITIAAVTLLPRPGRIYILSSIYGPILATPGLYFYITTQNNNVKEADNKGTIGKTGALQSKGSGQSVITFRSEFTTSSTNLSDVVQGLASLSSSGLIGILFGSSTNARNRADHPYVEISVFSMFFSLISSLMALMLLSQFRVDCLSPKSNGILIRTIGVSCVILFFMLMIAALAVSTHFLKWYTVTVLWPILLAVVTGLISRDHGITDDQKKIFSNGSKLVTSLPFGAIMGIFGAYLGSTETDMHLNICIFFMQSAFISGLILMLLLYAAPEKLVSMGVVFSSGISYLVFGFIYMYIMYIVH